MSKIGLSAATVLALLLAAPLPASAADALAGTPYTKGYLSQDDVARLGEELVFQRAVQTLSLGAASAQHVRHEGRIGGEVRQGL